MRVIYSRLRVRTSLLGNAYNTFKAFETLIAKKRMKDWVKQLALPEDLQRIFKKMDESGVEPETFPMLRERATNYATRPRNGP